MYSITDEYKEYTIKAEKYSKKNWEQIGKEINKIFKKFANIMNKGTNSQEAQNLVKQWQDFITKNFYKCTIIP